MTEEIAGPTFAETPSKTTKLATIVDLLRRPDGALMDELVLATSWQKHSVRGAISGTLKKKHGLSIASAVIKGRGRVYRIEAAEPTNATVSGDDTNLGAQA